MLALARTNLSEWADAGRLFEELYKEYPKLAPYHAYHAARCRLRRGDATGALDWAARVTKGTVPEAEAELVRIDALRSLARWDDALAAVDGYLQRFPNGPRQAEALFKKAEAMEKAGAAGERGAAGRHRRLVAIYRRVWAEAPLDVWGDRAAERLDQIAATLSPAEATSVRTRTAGEMVDARHGVLRPQPQRRVGDGVRGRARRAWAGRGPRVPRAFSPRAVGVEAAPAAARRAAVRRGRGRLRRAATTTCTPRRCTRGRVATRRWGTARRRWRATRASRPSTPTTATPTTRAFVRRSSRPTRRRGHRREDPRRRSPSATPRAICSTRRCGGWRSRPGAADATTRRCAGWTRTCASSRARRSGTPRDARCTGRGACCERRGKPDDARAWYERAVREYPLSVYALLSLTRLNGDRRRRRGRRWSTSLRKGLRDIPAWSFPARPLYGDPGFLRAVELARMGQGQRRAPRAGAAGAGDRRPRSGRAARCAPRRRIWSGSPPRCSIAAACGARRTPSPATA